MGTGVGNGGRLACGRTDFDWGSVTVGTGDGLQAGTKELLAGTDPNETRWRYRALELQLQGEALWALLYEPE